jgi:dihydrofolate reductase
MKTLLKRLLFGKPLYMSVFKDKHGNTYGGTIYADAVNWCDKIYLTRIHHTFNADTFFPEVKTLGFRLTSSEKFLADEKHAYDYTFEVWER